MTENNCNYKTGFVLRVLSSDYDALTSRLKKAESALDVAVDGLEKYRQTVVGSYAETTLEKIKEIMGEL